MPSKEQEAKLKDFEVVIKKRAELMSKSWSGIPKIEEYAEVTMEQAEMYRQHGDHTSLLGLMNNYSDIPIDLPNTIYHKKHLFYSGVAVYFTGEKDKGFSLCNQALRVAESEYEMNAIIYKTLSELHLDICQHEQAGECLEIAKDIVEKHNISNIVLSAGIANNLAYLYSELEKCDEASLIIDQALERANDNNSSYLLANFYFLKAGVASMRHDVVLTEKNFQIAKNLAGVLNAYKLDPYLEKFELILELNKQGIFKYDGKYLVNHEVEDIPAIHEQLLAPV